uniref:Uncharacterized protein n=1 Tax=Lotharella oceanica TaxID=641309 RepID=A0A7S2TT09_9EUKA|mmetsp:Transcript_26074/g.48604  ORF Transcript_26074/g.48604 Transcript_26074/m.48604 type:complete len:527 (+) Transcript_26074:445-2025(+)
MVRTVRIRLCISYRIRFFIILGIRTCKINRCRERRSSCDGRNGERFIKQGNPLKCSSARKLGPRSNKRRKHHGRQRRKNDRNLYDLLTASPRDSFQGQPASPQIDSNVATLSDAERISVYPGVSNFQPSQQVRQEHSETQQQQQHSQCSDQHPRLIQRQQEHFRTLWIPREECPPLHQSMPPSYSHSRTGYNPEGQHVACLPKAMDSAVLSNQHQHQMQNLQQLQYRQVQELQDFQQEQRIQQRMQEFQQQYDVNEQGPPMMVIQPCVDRHMMFVPANQPFMQPTGGGYVPLQYAPLMMQGPPVNYPIQTEPLSGASPSLVSLPNAQNLEIRQSTDSQYSANQNLTTPQQDPQPFLYSQRFSKPQQTPVPQQHSSESQRLPNQTKHCQHLSKESKSRRIKKNATKKLQSPAPTSASRHSEMERLLSEEYLNGALSDGRVSSWTKTTKDFINAEILNCGSRLKNTPPKQPRSAYTFFMLFMQSVMENDLKDKRKQTQKAMRGIGRVWSRLNVPKREVTSDLNVSMYG